MSLAPALGPPLLAEHNQLVWPALAALVGLLAWAGLRRFRRGGTDQLRQAAADLAAARETLRRKEQRYHSLVAAITAIVWDTPASGEFEMAQPGWSAFTGQTFEQLRGWGWLNAVHPDDRPLTAQVWSAAVASRSLYQVEHRLRRHDGVYRAMLVRAVPILADDGSIREWVGVHTDITDQNQAAQVLREARDAAEAANRTKSEFLANMSHELRTPMNGILGMTGLALETTLTRQQREYLTMVKSSADALLTILNDILDFSKIEAGKFTLDPVEFRLRDAFGDTLKALGVRAADKGLELICDVAADVPDRLRGDIGRLRQIVINLVGNAIKFTERGEVVVRVRVAEQAVALDGEEAEPSVTLAVAVRDTGIGIPPERLQSIFQPFVQADSSTTRRFGGTGLGLTISAHLVGMMHGRIGVESIPGAGSTFQFTARLGVPRTPAFPEPALPEQVQGLPVLVVDDNATNRRLLVDLLTNWSMMPTAVADGQAALAALREAHHLGKPFALVLLDVMMPDLDGYGVAARIADERELAATAILFLSSAAQREDAARCGSANIKGYLSKPIKPSELQELMLQSLSLPQAVSAPAPVPSAAHEPGRSLRVLLAEDNVVNQVLARHLLEQQGHQVVVVGDGRQAVDAVRADRFDLALMDVQMPEMGGYEATALIRQQETATGRRLPIIALTAHALKGDREQCLANGMDDYVCKPIQPALLWQAIDRLVGTGTVSDEPAVPPQAQPGVLALPAYLQKNPKVLRKLVPSFLQTSRQLLAEIGQALERGDAAQVSRSSHSLKSSVGNFGAETARQLSQQLETLGSEGNLAGAREVHESLKQALEELWPLVSALAPDQSG